MSGLPAHIIDAIKKRRERRQEEQRPFLEIPAPEAPPDSTPKEDAPKKNDKGVVIVDLSIDLYDNLKFEVMP